MTVDRTVTHLEGTDFQKSRAFSPAIVTQGGKIVWLAGQTALTDLDGKSIAHDFEGSGPDLLCPHRPVRSIAWAASLPILSP
jgi:hypothetical protein